MTEALNRKALYDLVWSKPMIQLAKEYGLSDRGLAKLCERNSIPVPPRGYWAKKEVGQKVKKAPLITLEGSEPETAILLRKAMPVTGLDSADKKEPAMPEAIQEAIERERLPGNQIKVPATIHNAHFIVSSWIKTEEYEQQMNKRLGYTTWRSSITPLDRRKWRLTSCLFKQLEARGFRINEEGSGRHRKEVWIRYDNDKVSFNICERIRQYRREPTAEEKEGYSSSRKWIQIRENTGKLEIILAPDGNDYSKVKIQEENFEESLNEVVIKVIETMWMAKSNRLKQEEIDRKQRQEENERYERKQAAEDEKRRKLNLGHKAASWKRAQEIREYIAAV